MTKPTTFSCPSGEPCSLSAELDQLKQEVERLSGLVSTDPLTQLYNYRYFSHTLDQEIERSQRTLQHTTLIMLDVDHFKRVNDEWGHEIGNQALQLIARCLKENIRKLDIPCRYGGEEFSIILPSTDITTGAQVAERVRKSIESTPLMVDKAQNVKDKLCLTVSLGLSMYNGNENLTAKQVIETADHELYRAKTQGRNQVCYSTPDISSQQVSHEEKSALFDIFTPNED